MQQAEYLQGVHDKQQCLLFALQEESTNMNEQGTRKKQLPNNREDTSIMNESKTWRESHPIDGIQISRNF